MAELTNLESKLGEVVGLAMAAQEAGQKVAKLAKEEGNDELVGTLERMRAQAKETEQRGTEVASSFEGKKTAILDEARDVKGKAQEMMKTYLDEAADALDGFEFLTMAEAGEVGHWEILDTLNKRAGESRRLRARRLGSADPAAAPRNGALEHHSGSRPRRTRTSLRRSAEAGRRSPRRRARGPPMRRLLTRRSDGDDDAFVLARHEAGSSASPRLRVT